MARKLLLIGAMAAFVFLLAACTSPWQKAAQQSVENQMENAIEEQTGQDADVNVDENSVEISTDEGSLQAGEDVKLPQDFPGDIYVYDGKLSAVLQTIENEGYSITIETDDPIGDIMSLYESKLKSDGWEITGSMNFESTASLAAEKGERSLSVVAGSGEAGNTIVITTSGK